MVRAPGSARIQVLLADDHTLVRAGLRRLLDALPDVEVVAEASDGAEALEAAKQLRPEVAVLDLSMPVLNGLQVAEHLATEAPEVRVLMLSVHAEQEHVLRALTLGVGGFLLKSSSPPDLARAVRATAAGESYLCPAAAGHLVAASAGRPAADGRVSLTPRQLQVLQLVAKGRRNKEIARDLRISVKTVESHRSQVMQRLRARHVACLVREAVRRGLLPP